MTNVRNAPFLAGLTVPNGIDLSFGDIRVEKPGVRQFNPNRALGALSNPVQLFSDLKDEGFPINSGVFNGSRFYSGEKYLPEVALSHQFPIFDYATLEEVDFYDKPLRKKNYITRLEGRTVVEITYCPYVKEVKALGLTLGNRLFERTVMGKVIDYSAASEQIDSLLSDLFTYLGLDCGTARVALVGGGAGAQLVSVHPQIVSTDAQNILRAALPQIMTNYLEVQG